MSEIEIDLKSQIDKEKLRRNLDLFKTTICGYCDYYVDDEEEFITHLIENHTEEVYDSLKEESEEDESE